MKRYRVQFKRTSDAQRRPSFMPTKTFMVYGENQEDAVKSANQKIYEYMCNVIDSYGRDSRSMSTGTYEIESIEVSTKEEKFDPNVKSLATRKKYVSSPFCPAEILSKFAKEEPDLQSEILRHQNTPDSIRLEILERFSKSFNWVERCQAAEHEMTPKDLLVELCVDEKYMVRKDALTNLKESFGVDDELIDVIDVEYGKKDPYGKIRFKDLLESIFEIKEEVLLSNGYPRYLFYGTAACSTTSRLIRITREDKWSSFNIRVVDQNDPSASETLRYGGRLIGLSTLVMGTLGIDFEGFLRYASDFKITELSS